MLESEERRKVLPPEEILGKIHIKNTDVVIDFGCGIGFFSIPAAKLAKKVIAIDESEIMVKELKRRTEKIKNIEVIKDNKISQSADLILLITVLHEIENVEEFIKNCFTLLNDNGRLIIIDWAKKETIHSPPLNHKISKEEAIRMTKRKAIEHEINNDFYFLEFENKQVI